MRQTVFGSSTHAGGVRRRHVRRDALDHAASARRISEGIASHPTPSYRWSAALCRRSSWATGSDQRARSSFENAERRRCALAGGYHTLESPSEDSSPRIGATDPAPTSASTRQSVARSWGRRTGSPRVQRDAESGARSISFLSFRKPFLRRPSRACRSTGWCSHGAPTAARRSCRRSRVSSNVSGCASACSAKYVVTRSGPTPSDSSGITPIPTCHGEHPSFTVGTMRATSSAHSAGCLRHDGGRWNNSISSDCTQSRGDAAAFARTCFSSDSMSASVNTRGHAPC